MNPVKADSVLDLDTAAFYNNEKDLGASIRELDIPRDNIFITTKIWYSDHGYEKVGNCA